MASEEQLAYYRVPAKPSPIPKSFHPHLPWWLNEENILWGSPLHSLSCRSDLYRCIKQKRLGTHLGYYTSKGVQFIPENKLHINFLVQKSGPFGPKEIQPLCKGLLVLVATYTATLVAYINKKGGIRSGSPLVPPQADLPEGLPYTRPSNCESRKFFHSQ